jgi:aryl-alcohol dehydrogenase-like predicted oxidoreductase
MHATEQTWRLGGDSPIDRLGYGAMRIVGQPGNFGPPADRAASLAVLRAAVEAGVTFIDTAAAYGPGVSKELIAEALRGPSGYPDGVVVATKGGIEKAGPTAADIRSDGRPEALRAGALASRERLRVERIDLYQLHRPDPDVPFEAQVQALAELRDEGVVRHLGLSNVTAAQLDAALAIAPIASVQNRFGLLERGDEALVDRCAREGIAYLPYGPLGAQPMRPGSPLGDGGPGPVAQVAERHGATAAQVALAWLLHRSPSLVPIPGTTSLAHLAENVAARELRLDDADLAALDAVA